MPLPVRNPCPTKVGVVETVLLADGHFAWATPEFLSFLLISEE